MGLDEGWDEVEDGMRWKKVHSAFVDVVDKHMSAATGWSRDPTLLFYSLVLISHSSSRRFSRGKGGIVLTLTDRKNGRKRVTSMLKRQGGSTQRPHPRRLTKRVSLALCGN
jgi:hypothetical protein